MLDRKSEPQQELHYDNSYALASEAYGDGTELHAESIPLAVRPKIEVMGTANAIALVCLALSVAPTAS
jgi:hypothetical protein